MKLSPTVWLLPLACCAFCHAQSRADWMPQAQWGVMTHYLADWQARDHGLTMSVDQWNKMVDGFDVEGMAKALESVGARYYQISIGQNSGYYLSPNAAYDKIVGIQPSKCSRRDLVADLAAALSKRGIRLLVYLPSGAPAGDKIADTALEWRNGPLANKEFQRKWEQVIREWSLRWGKKVAGWWFDGCYFLAPPQRPFADHLLPFTLELLIRKWPVPPFQRGIGDLVPGRSARGQVHQQTNAAFRERGREVRH